MTPTRPPGEKIDLRDPHMLAMSVVELQGQFGMLNQTLATAVSNMGGTLQAVQGDLRKLQEGQHELGERVSELHHHGSGLERLGRSIEKLVEDNERRWAAHEMENKAVADTVTSHTGAVKIVSWISAIVLSLVAVIFTLKTTEVNRQFAEASEDRHRIENAHNADVVRLEARLNRLEAGAKESRDREGVAP